jgi:hypothetical protein
MKRRLYLFATLAAVGLLGVTSAVVYGTGYRSGISPQTNTLNITVTVPALVGIYLERDADINLGLAPNLGHFPPSPAWPGYYEDNTNPISGGPTTDLSAFTNNATGYTLTVQAGAATYYPSLPVSQTFYADKTLYPGQQITPDGQGAPGAPWLAFSSAGGTAVASKITPTSGWEAHNQIFELQMLGTESAGTGVVTMTYTIVSNP